MIEKQNGVFIVESHTVTKGEGRLVCSCGTNRCSHIAQVSAYLNNNRSNGRDIVDSAASQASNNSHVGASAAAQSVSDTGFEPDEIKALEIMRVIPERTPAPVLRMFSRFCTDSGLSPFKRQIYLQKRRAKRNGVYVDNFSIEPGIDGLRAIAEQTGNYAGSDDAIFEHNDAHHPIKATVTVWKFVKGIRCPFTTSARWDEYVPQEDWMWRKMPHGQLEKCAEAKALRKAFPNLAGMYVPEEMERASVDIDHNAVSASRKEAESITQDSTKTQTPVTDSAQAHPGAIGETKGDILPSQQSAIRNLCADMNRSPDEWLMQTYGANLETCTQGVAKKAIPTLNLLRSSQANQKK